MVAVQARADSEFAAEAGADMADGEEDGQENKPTGPAWEGTDRDYSYEELLGEASSHHATICVCWHQFHCISALCFSSPPHCATYSWPASKYRTADSGLAVLLKFILTIASTKRLH